MAQKFTLLLCERRSTLERFPRIALDRDSGESLRERLPGGTLFLGLSMESVRDLGVELGAALHALVAANLTLNLVDGFRDGAGRAPLWFQYGLAPAASRGADERFALYASGTQRDQPGAERWEPRVEGLVANGFAPTWKEMAGWQRFEDLQGPGHLVAWSKVAWIRAQGPERARVLLLSLTDPVPALPPEERAKFLSDRQLTALEAAFQAGLSELEERWRRWTTRPNGKR